MLRVRHVSKSYVGGLFSGKRVSALADLSFEVHRGEVFGIVGESGSGKTTLARMLLGLTRPDSGRILFRGEELAAFGQRGMRAFRRVVQPITQHCETALNPRMTIRESLKEVFRLKEKGAFEKVTHGDLARMLTRVGLKAEHLDRYPGALSGGELQRVVIARVMALEPGLIIADEPTSSLDVISQARIMGLLLSLKEKIGATIILISHDPALVNAVCDRVLTLKRGKE